MDELNFLFESEERAPRPSNFCYIVVAKESNSNKICYPYIEEESELRVVVERRARNTHIFNNEKDALNVCSIIRSHSYQSFSKIEVCTFLRTEDGVIYYKGF